MSDTGLASITIGDDTAVKNALKRRAEQEKQKLLKKKAAAASGDRLSVAELPVLQPRSQRSENVLEAGAHGGPGSTLDSARARLSTNARRKKDISTRDMQSELSHDDTHSGSVRIGLNTVEMRDVVMATDLARIEYVVQTTESTSEFRSMLSLLRGSESGKGKGTLDFMTMHLLHGLRGAERRSELSIARDLAYHG
eukprot:605974-Amphidinium_carterae.1